MCAAFVVIFKKIEINKWIKIKNKVLLKECVLNYLESFHNQNVTFFKNQKG